ncbi:hypothetical protein GCM10010510_47220 [Streptomyces anandii JCM 4720]|nr:hypothetical protein GCM10010510_47220 [Streptomyces anandii JCM 4720]
MVLSRGVGDAARSGFPRRGPDIRGADRPESGATFCPFRDSDNSSGTFRNRARRATLLPPVNGRTKGPAAFDRGKPTCPYVFAAAAA